MRRFIVSLSVSLLLIVGYFVKPKTEFPFPTLPPLDPAATTLDGSSPEAFTASLERACGDSRESQAYFFAKKEVITVAASKRAWGATGAMSEREFMDAVDGMTLDEIHTTAIQIEHGRRRRH